MKVTICAALCLGLGLPACAVDAPPPAAVTSATSALECAPFDQSYCDPVANCDLGSTSNHDGQFLTCASGIIMFAWSTPDCRWCINRDVCGLNDFIACPFS